MTQPTLASLSFKCMHCEIVAQQRWHRVGLSGESSQTNILSFAMTNLSEGTHLAGDATIVWSGTSSNYSGLKRFTAAVCSNCEGLSLWLVDRCIFPIKSTAPAPSPDLPPEAATDYEEAARVLPYSPRAATALLRLCTEKLLGSLLQRSDRIDNMIGDMVKLGISPMLQEAMDVLRVTGNEAVHPGQMEDIDDLGTALSMFGLVNLIVDQMITQPKHVGQLFANLPAGKRAAIQARNAKVSRETS